MAPRWESQAGEQVVGDTEGVNNLNGAAYRASSGC